jgi:serine/threonine protein kinase/WD40 repeat protein
MNPRDPRVQELNTTQIVRRLWKAWMAGEPSELDRILADDPSIENDPESLADLVYSEFWLRKQIDSKVTESEYVARFPSIAKQLLDQFAVSRELFGIDVSSSSSTPLSEPSSNDITKQSYDSMVPKGFTSLGLLGVGGMGVVIKAQQWSLDREVAIKSLKNGAWVTDADRERLRKEAHVVGQLKHPNIVQIYDVIEEDGKLFLIMEYVAGASLAQVIATKPTDPTFASNSIRSIVCAIQAAHVAGFLHRDIKPSNVLLSEAGEIKVTDFGLARAANGSNLSMSGELLGTLAYMAPEQVTGRKSSIDSRVDVYGIGATLYELLTGRPPFIGNTPAETLMQVVHATPKQIRDMNPAIPRDLASICHRCIEKLPEKRYRSVVDLQEDIDRFLIGKPTKARPVSKLERTKRWIQSHPSQFISVVVACFAAVSLLVTSTWYITRLASLESIGESRELALSEAKQRSHMDSYYALASSIQSRVFERKVGWTWEAQNAIRDAMRFSPSKAEQLKLRDMLCKTLFGFDLRLSSVVLGNLDPFGLAWSADGAWLAIGENILTEADDGSEVHLVYVLGDWPERKLKEIRFPAVEPIDPKNGAIEGIRSLAFLDDNRSLVVGCRSGWIQILDVTTGEITAKWKGHNDWCWAIAYDPVRSWLATGSRDGSIHIWDSKTYQKLQTLSTSGSVNYLAILKDRIVAMGTEQSRFMLPNFDRILETQPQPYNYSSFQCLNDGNSLLLASSFKISCADTEFNETQEFSLRRTPFTKSNSIRHIDSSASGGFAAVSSYENVLFADTVGKTELMSIAMPGMGYKYVTFDRKGSSIWITNNYQLLRYDWHPPEVWSIGTKVGKETKCISESPIEQSCTPSFTTNGASVLVHTRVNGARYPWMRVLIGNVPKKDTLIECLYDSIGGKVDSLTTLGFLQLRAAGIWNSTEHILTVSGNRLHQGNTPDETAFCLSADGLYYWTGDKVKTVDGRSVGRLRVLRMSDGAELFAWENLESEKNLRLSRIEQIGCGTDVTVIISVDRKVRAFDSNSFQLIREVDLGPGATLKRVALAEDKSIVYVGTQEGNVLKVELETGRIDSIQSQDAEITAIAISPDGVLAIGNPEGNIELWSIDRREPEQLCRLVTLPNSIQLLEFSRDGKKLAVQVDGESAARVLDWNAFRARLRDFDLDWMNEKRN